MKQIPDVDSHLQDLLFFMAIHTTSRAFFLCLMAIDAILVIRGLGIHRSFRSMAGITFLGGLAHMMALLATDGSRMPLVRKGYLAE